MKKLRRIPAQLEPLERRLLLSGVTIITHGFNGSVDGWINAMANEMAARTETPQQTSIWTVGVTNSNDPGVSSVRLDAGPDHFFDDYNGESIIKLDWSSISGGSVSTGQVAQASADYLLNTVINGQSWIDGPIHLIGHSRGASVVTELARELGEHGVWIDHVTTLDPHPVDGIDEPLPADYGDAPVVAWENVVFQDNYWRTEQIFGCASFDPCGHSVPGSFDHKLSEDILETAGYSFPTVGEHADTHLWYHATIDTGGTVSDGDITFNPDTTNWFNPQSHYGPRDSVGFHYSLIGGGDRLSGASVAGLHSALGGSGTRSAINQSQATRPTVVSVSPASNQPGQLEVDISWHDMDSQTTVSVFLDVDPDSTNGNEIHLTSVTAPVTGAGVLTTTVAASTNSIAGGNYRLLVRASDGANESYLYAPEPLLITAQFPGLVATSFDAIPDHVLSGVTDVSFAISNQGDADAVAFTIDVLLSDDGVIDALDEVVETIHVPGLAAGGSMMWTIPIVLPLDILNQRALADDSPDHASGHVSTSSDMLGIMVDANNAVVENDEGNNIDLGKGIAKDDVTYFPWDINANGVVTATDAIFVINRLGQSANDENRAADFDGSGAITPTDAIAAINRLGYLRNESVIEPLPIQAAQSEQLMNYFAYLIAQSLPPQRTSLNDVDDENPEDSLSG